MTDTRLHNGRNPIPWVPENIEISVVCENNREEKPQALKKLNNKMLITQMIEIALRWKSFLTPIFRTLWRSRIKSVILLEKNFSAISEITLQMMMNGSTMEIHFHYFHFWRIILKTKYIFLFMLRFFSISINMHMNFVAIHI